MNTQELDEKYDALMVKAYERGVVQGTHDRLAGYCNPTPLSGEWAGESIEELLGDLIRRAEAICGNDYEAHNDICDNYETGYHDGNYEA